MLTAAMKAWSRQRGRERCLLTPELTAEIVEGLIEGGSLRSLGQRPDMPCAHTLYNWVAKRREFAVEVIQACEDRDDWYRDQIMEVLLVHGFTPQSRAMATPLVRRLARLQNFPGRKWLEEE
jgi:hypothetical protein